MRTSALLLLSLPALVFAQDGGGGGGSGNNNLPSPDTKASETKSETKTTPTPTTAQNTETTQGPPVPDLTTKSTGSIIEIKPTGVPGLTDAGGDLPSITDLPDLPLDWQPGGAYTIPKVTPPPTKNAPFMQKSRLPEGTVFIAVGAGLGFILLVIFLWRAFVAWSLHRSVQRVSYSAAAAAATTPGKISKKKTRDEKSGGGGGFYAAGPGSQHSLDHLASMGRSPAPTNASGLFFSPTGAPATPGAAGGDRRSGYYPAGFYGGAGNRQSICANSFRGGVPPQGVSPPGSPLMEARTHNTSGSRGTERAALGMMRGGEVSQSSLSLPPTGRAPSAVLEDLFESHRQPPGRY